MIRTLRPLTLPLLAALCLATPMQGLAQAHAPHPPADAAPTPVAGVHMEGVHFAAHLLIDPGQVGEATATAFIMDEDLEPFAPQAVTLSLSNPAAGIEPVPMPMEFLTEEEAWQAGPIPLPAAGTWLVVLELQIPDSEATRLEGEVEILP